jgi:hypothetical protein
VAEVRYVTFGDYCRITAEVLGTTPEQVARLPRIALADSARRTIRDGRSAKSMDWETNGSFQLRRFLVIPKGRLTLREARSLHSAAEGWVQLLGVWIDVVARVDLRQERIKEDKWGHRAYVWVARSEDGGELLNRFPTESSKRLSSHGIRSGSTS